MLGLTASLDINFNYSGSFSLNWLGWLCLGLPLVLIVAFVVVGSRNRQAAEAAAAVKLEGDLEQAMSRARENPPASVGMPPTLPASVMASIWTHRFVEGTTQEFPESRRQSSMWATVHWGFDRAAPYIVAVAFMNLRDAGLVRLTVGPPSNILNSFTRARVAPTEAADSASGLAEIESGLLGSSLKLASKRPDESAGPSAYAVVRDWIGETRSNPTAWVHKIATGEGQRLGLYEPVKDERRGVTRLLTRSPEPNLSIPRLAACEDQVAGCVSRWREFGTAEPELQQVLLTEVTYGIQSRQPTS